MFKRIKETINYLFTPGELGLGIFTLCMLGFCICLYLLLHTPDCEQDNMSSYCIKSRLKQSCLMEVSRCYSENTDNIQKCIDLMDRCEAISLCSKCNN